MPLGLPGQIEDDDRDADAAAEVAHQAEQRRAFVAVARCQGGESDGGQRHEDKAQAQALSDADRAIAEALGPILAARGLLLVGLDVIGDRLTEINVTSPTCFQEITDQTGFDVAGMFVDALEAALQYPVAG